MAVRPTLASFEITNKTGFLPETPPLASLPPHFREWNKVLGQVSHLLQNHQLRDAVHKLPALEFSDKTLHNIEEWRAAVMVLSGLFQGFLWQEGEAGVPSKIPSNLAVPFVTVSRKIGLPPIGTYASTVLYNWRLRNPEQPMTVENVESIINLTGTEDESWFFTIHVMIELKAAPAIEGIWNGLQAMEDGDNTVLGKSLADIEAALIEITRVLERMSEGCDPKTFYVSIRPYLAGTKGIEAVPNGILYEGVDEEPKQFHGGSGTESTSVRAIDCFLGVQHFEHSRVFDELMAYMPAKHGQFLQYVSEQSSLRKYIVDSNDSDLVKQFNATIEALVTFRNRHFVVVARFITNQREHSVFSSLEDTGTGGTKYIDFLKTVRDKTRAAKILL